MGNQSNKKHKLNERRTSGITPMQVLNVLAQQGYAIVSASGQDAPSTAFRKVVRETQGALRRFVAPELLKAGHAVVTSRTGDSFYMEPASGGVRIMLPAKGHMTDNAIDAIDAIEQKTGIALRHLEQQRARP